MTQGGSGRHPAIPGSFRLLLVSAVPGKSVPSQFRPFPRTTGIPNGVTSTRVSLFSGLVISCFRFMPANTVREAELLIDISRYVPARLC